MPVTFVKKKRTRKKGIKPRSAKAKGGRFQQEVIAKLVEILGLNPADLESRPSGSNGEDIIMGVHSRERFPYSLECKNRKTMLGVYDGYDQAKANAPDGAEPLYVVRMDHRKPLAIMDLDHFLVLFDQIKKLSEKV